MQSASSFNKYSILVIAESDADSAYISSILKDSTSSELVRVSFSVQTSRNIKSVDKLMRNSSIDLIVLCEAETPRSVELNLAGLKEVNVVLPIVVVGCLKGKCKPHEVVAQGAVDYLPMLAAPYGLFRSISLVLQGRHAITVDSSSEVEIGDPERIRADFLANMSHEMRTPLTAILGFSELVQKSNRMHPDDMKCLDAIYANAKHLMQVISDILDITKIEAGELKVQTSWCELRPMLADLARTFSHHARIKDLEFKLIGKKGVPLEILTDRLRLKQILYNLISNAVKFTRTGGIEVEVSFSGSKLVIEVSDTGIGISPQLQRKLFTAFSQADSSIERSFGGVGLGLYISNFLSTELGGRIEFESLPENGSTFTLTLDDLEHRQVFMVKDTHEWANEIKQDSMTIQGSVLIVDDCEYNRDLLQLILSGWDLETACVENGLEALRAVEVDEFDLILMDMHMPIMNGYEATAKIKEIDPDVPIVAVTASVLLESRNKCLDAGCDDYLQKPFQHADLERIVTTYLPMFHEVVLENEEGEDEFQRICEKFRSGLPARINEMQIHYQERNFVALKESVHKLASAGLFGFYELAKHASQLEQRIIANNYAADDYTEYWEGLLLECQSLGQE